MQKKLFLVFITLFIPEILFGQNTLKIDNVDFIKYGNYKLSYYTFINDSIFEIFVDSEETEQEFNNLIVDEEYFFRKKNNIEKGNNIIEIKDIPYIRKSRCE